MKKTLFAVVAMFAVIGSASADTWLVSPDESSFSTDSYKQVSGKPGKTREQVLQELSEHQKRMRNDRAYAQEWDSMYSEGEGISYGHGMNSEEMGKSRQQVLQELNEHQKRMKNDRAYAQEWRSMYEIGD